jgi:hypothetical protein
MQIPSGNGVLGRRRGTHIVGIHFSNHTHIDVRVQGALNFCSTPLLHEKLFFCSN